MIDVLTAKIPKIKTKIVSKIFAKIKQSPLDFDRQLYHPVRNGNLTK